MTLALIGGGIAVFLILVGVFALGAYYGAKMGVRIFAPDAIILAFRTLDANPEKFASMKDQALNYPDHEAWIQKMLDNAPKRSLKEQTIAEIDEINSRAVVSDEQ
jgi:hypothetical protein